MPSTVSSEPLGYGTDIELLELFNEHEVIQDTIERDNTDSTEEALIELYKRLRPGEPPTVESARNLINSLFFDPKRYDMADVGRYKLNKKLGLDVDPDKHCLDEKDIVETVRYMLKIIDNHPDAYIDDIDHLGTAVCSRGTYSKPVPDRPIQDGAGCRERMTIQDIDVITPQALINIRPVVAAIKEFFGSSQLSQFMDQTNPLAELTHKRRLSALGPGGLSGNGQVLRCVTFTIPTTAECALLRHRKVPTSV